MPIDDYLGNLKGHRYIKQKITPKREKYPPITSLTKIFLEGKQYKNYNYPDLLISTTYLPAQNWDYAHELLDDLDSFMLTPRQFIDYLKLLKSGNACDQYKRKLNPKFLIYKFNNIINTDKLIWLDTEFRIQGDAKFIYYNHLNTSEGPVAHDRHFLNPFDFLISDCCLTLDNFLATPNSFGLPYSKSNYGNFLIKYHSPQRDGNVATYGGSDIIERRFNLNTEKEVFRPHIVGDPLTFPMTFKAQKC